MITTPLCRALGIDVPIWNAGMGGGVASRHTYVFLPQIGSAWQQDGQLERRVTLPCLHVT